MNTGGFKRLIKYASVGVSTFLIDLGILFSLTTFFHVFYLYAVAIGFGIGITLNYIISRTWVFKGTARTIHHGYIYFVGGGVVSLGVVLTLVGILVGTLGIPLLIARGIVSGIVGIGNYLFNLYINFNVAGKHS